jgi:transcription elongation factor GreA
MTKDKLQLTREGLEKLKDELKDLKENRRIEATQKIARAREFGDISENSEYDAARDEQSFIEGRIMELEELLRNAEVVSETSIAKGIVSIGSKVLLESDGEKDEYHIVSSVEADPMSGKISNESPVGKALLGKKVGDMIEINTNIKASYKVVSIK